MGYTPPNNYRRGDASQSEYDAMYEAKVAIEKVEKIFEEHEGVVPDRFVGHIEDIHNWLALNYPDRY